MKKITIGRGRECDVRIDDSSDKVSRRQATIKVNFFGKMEIYDLGANGTFVNGKKVEKPNPLPVKRGDQVNFAHIVDLDWSKVRNPYKGMKIALLISIIVIAALCVVWFLFSDTIIEKLNLGDDTKDKIEKVEIDDKNSEIGEEQPEIQTDQVDESVQTQKNIESSKPKTNKPQKNKKSQKKVETPKQNVKENLNNEVLLPRNDFHKNESDGQLSKKIKENAD